MVQVHHEWGTLKEVVCRNSLLEDPQFAAQVRLQLFGPTEGIKFMEANPGKSLEEADPATFKAANDQMNAAIAILEKRGVTIHRPQPVNDVELTYNENIFPFQRDSVLSARSHAGDRQPIHRDRAISAGAAARAFWNSPGAGQSPCEKQC